MPCVSQWRLVALLGVAVGAAACSVADSYHIEPAAIRASAYSDAVPTLCRSTLGSYALPKSFLRIKVQRTGDGPADLLAPETIVRADKSLTFCLDHIADPMADDEVRIIKSSGQIDPSYGTAGKLGSQFAVEKKIDGNKDYGSQILQWVVSNTVDQSERIAKTLVRTAFIALSGKVGFTPLSRAGQNPAKPVMIASFEYDPFDPERSAQHNQTLRDLGYCLVLENFTFDVRSMTVEQYCNSPRHLRFPYEEAYARYRSGTPPVVSGIAYRPRISYALSIYKNDNANGKRRWRLDRYERVALENISPIVSVGITRSIFAARRVALKFDMGTLEAMCLVKTSELQSAVTVPYEVAKSIVALPTQIFEVKIGNISDNIDLLKAESALIGAQKAYLDMLSSSATSFDNKSPKTVSPTPGIPNPTVVPKELAIGDSVSANLAELQSSVLTEICRDAPVALGSSWKG